MNSSEKEREEKLIKTIIPKISDYFKENTFLEKENLQEFLEYLGITAWNKENDEEKNEEIWNSLSKDSQEQKLQKIIVIKNITDYIHNHGNELIPPERTLESSVEKFLLSPIQAIYTNENINEDDETIFEFLKYLSLIQFSNNNTIPFFELEKYLKENKFINLNIEKIMEIINNFSKQNLKELKKDLYFKLIEQLGNKFKNKFSDFAKKLKTFEEYELNEPKLKNFENIIDFSNILLKINDSLISIKEKLIESISNNDKLKSEFYKKYFNVFISDIQVYVYEIERIYYEQNQKFDYFINKINTKINLLNEEKLVLENKLNNQKEETEKKCDKKIKKITEKYEKLQEESEKLKKEIENLQNDIRQKDDNLLIVNNKNSLLENNKNEMDIKYHLLEKEKENLNKREEKLLEAKALLNSKEYELKRQKEIEANKNSIFSTPKEESKPTLTKAETKTTVTSTSSSKPEYYKAFGVPIVVWSIFVFVFALFFFALTMLLKSTNSSNEKAAFCSIVVAVANIFCFFSAKNALKCPEKRVNGSYPAMVFIILAFPFSMYSAFQNIIMCLFKGA